MIVSFF